MTRLRLTAVVLLVLVAGCGNDDPPPAATPTTAAPSPTVDNSRTACHQVSTTEERGVTAHLEPGVALTVAKAAQLSPDFGIAAAGLGLLEAAQAAAAVDDPRGNPNVAVGQAWLDLAQACQELYGEGPW
jgi:hypothetical protein